MSVLKYMRLCARTHAYEHLMCAHTWFNVRGAVSVETGAVAVMCLLVHECIGFTPVHQSLKRLLGCAALKQTWHIECTRMHWLTDARIGERNADTYRCAPIRPKKRGKDGGAQCRYIYLPVRAHQTKEEPQHVRRCHCLRHLPGLRSTCLRPYPMRKKSDSPHLDSQT